MLAGIDPSRLKCGPLRVLFAACLSTARLGLLLKRNLGFLWQRNLPSVRRVHADDAALSMVVSGNVG